MRCMSFYILIDLCVHPWGARIWAVKPGLNIRVVYMFLELMVGPGVKGSPADITSISSWASYQIHKIAVCACAGNIGKVFPATAGYRSRHASWHVRDAHAVMHAGIDNYRFPFKLLAGGTFPVFPAHVQHATLRIW